MRIHSDALREGGALPRKYTKDGDDASPPLAWSDVPSRAKALALVFEVTTPHTQEPQALWLAYDIPPETDGLPEKLTRTPDLEEPVALRQGVNDLEKVGYDGPLGTEGRRFDLRFRLYALDEPLGLAGGADKRAFEHALEGHVLDRAELATAYTRPGE